MARRNALMAIQPSAGAEKPPVYNWYVAYCIVMAIMYLLIAVFGVLLVIYPGLMSKTHEDVLAHGITGAIYIVLGIVLLVLYVIALFLPPKPRVWIYGIVLIAIGMTSCCCLPVTIPLLIYWIKPDVKRYFGRME